MELREFISETLKQMIDGVSEAQEYAKDHKAQINTSHMRPTTEGKKDDFAIADGSGRYANIIHFDIAVHTGENSGGKGGGGNICWSGSNRFTNFE